MPASTSIYSDSKRYLKQGGHSFLAKFLTSPGMRFMCAYRLCNRLARLNPFSIIAKVWFKHMQVKYGFQIPHTCPIGAGLFLGHYGNIVVNQGCVIGKNCNIAQGVTLGYVSRGKKKGNPTIGDQVWIGANAVIVGNIKIGNNVLVAPLTYVNFDVPDNAVVSGNPAVIINYNGTSEYIKNMV